MIRLYQFPAAFGVANPSPFCIKVETWLRLAGLDYEVELCRDPRKSPLGKLPFVEDDGKTVADSTRIIEHLSRKHDVDLDAGLSAEQKAVALSFDRMLGEHTYWGLIFARWIEPGGWAQIRPAFFGPLPALLRPVVAGLVRRKQRQTLRLQGLGLLGREEIYRRVERDIGALSDYLGAKSFFMGERPVSVDATVYAFLASCWEAELDTPLKARVARHANLTAYCRRMRAHCFEAAGTLPERSRRREQARA